MQLFALRKGALHTLRGGAVWSARRAHNPKVGGSNPPPATKISTGKNGKCSRLFFISDLEFAPGAYRQILQCLYGKWVESTRLRYLVPDYFGYYCLLRSYVTLLVTGVKTDEETARILQDMGAAIFVVLCPWRWFGKQCQLQKAAAFVSRLCKRSSWANGSKGDVTCVSNKYGKGKIVRSVGNAASQF